MRCLCCDKELNNVDEYEQKVSWHRKCIKRFFGMNELPELQCTDADLERLANATINKGLTVPGVQKKLSLHLESVDRKARLTIVDYPTGYILKPQSTDFSNLPEMEFMSMKMAEAVGIKTVPNALIKLNDSYAYITKRIDRDKGKMYAMEDFCQLSNRLTEDKYRGSYEGCGRVITNYSRNAGLDKVELLYRLMFCFLTGNSDMHLKNFSLIENQPKSRIFGLSPAYDMLPVNVVMPADKEQMALTMNGKKRNLHKKDFWVFAESLKIEKKVAERLAAQLLRKKKIMLDVVREAYIPESAKEEMVNLIEERSQIFDI